jgi:hypothetical protein
MRKPTLLLLLAAAGCGDPEPTDYVVIDDFLARSPPLSCEPLAPPGHLAVTELRTASDTSVLVLDGPGRRVVELDAALRPVWALDLPAEGPGAINSPVGVTLLADTAIAIAERRGFQLVVFHRSGRLVRTVPLGFAPSAVAALPSGELLVTAMPFGPVPVPLAHRFDGAALREVPVPARPYDDMFVGALGNTTLAAALPGGDALVVHQFMAPRAFRIAPDGVPTPVRVPTPDATRSSIDYVPVGPIREEQIERMLVPAAALTVDPTRGDVFLLTRSGRRTERGMERAVLRLDAGLGLAESFTLGVIARHLAYLARPGALIRVDDEDGFHACDIPPGRRHARTD